MKGIASFLISLVIIFSVPACKAQTSGTIQNPEYSKYDQYKVYRSLEVALRHKDDVKVLSLWGKGLKEFPLEITEFRNLKVLSH